MAQKRARAAVMVDYADVMGEEELRSRVPLVLAADGPEWNGSEWKQKFAMKVQCKFVAVFGLHRSCTNYVEKHVHELCDATFLGGRGQCTIAGKPFWKHVVPLRYICIAPAKMLQKTACLMCVRHPVSWMVSMAKASGYEYFPFGKTQRRTPLTIKWMCDPVKCEQQEGNQLHWG